MTLQQQIDFGLTWLQANEYPGRGIVCGIDDVGNPIQVYWIMGRSFNSQNRVFECDEDGRLYTVAADPAKVQDPSLIIYNAMRVCDDECHIVSNGDQTDTVYDSFMDEDAPLFLSYALRNREFEPDKPNFTPRITGITATDPSGFYVELSLLKRCEHVGGKCVRQFFEYNDITPGVGFCITTYDGDGDPLPSFTGEPRAMPLQGTPEEILETYWNALNPEYRVAIAMKVIDPLDGSTSRILILNRFSKVA